MKNRLIACFSGLLCLCFFVLPVQAQISGALSGGGGSNLVTEPRYPEPGEEVRIELSDYSLNTTGATFTWYVNGVEQIVAKNERKIMVKAGELGSKLTVQVVTRLPGGATLEAKTIIAPVRVDLLIAADTLTPSFYPGRALPSSGSSIQVTAIPFTGNSTTPENYSYTWRVGGEVISGSSRFGKNSVTFTSGFERNVTVSVDVIDQNGYTITSESILVPISDPELYFYEVNPLEGLRQQALGKNYIFVGDEMRVRAEPYFVSRTLMSQNPFLEWKLNGKTITNQSSDQQEIVLRKTGSRGSFELEFHVRNLAQLLQGVKDSVTISF